MLAGCASGPGAAVASALRQGKLSEALAAYDRGKPDRALLRSIALRTLERAAYSVDANERGEALAALVAGGKLTQPALERFVLHGEGAALRARALLALAGRGDAAAKVALRSKLDTDDSDVRAAAIASLDPESDAELLAALTEHPASSVRLAAVKVLLRAAPRAETRLRLERVTGHDPDLRVRAAGLLALARQGVSAFDAVLGRLDDSERSVRMAAIDVLVDLDFVRAERELERSLGAAPSAEGIEAARALLGADRAHPPATARVQLERALGDRDGALRAQAAVALMSLRDASLRPLAEERAKLERVRGVRLCLAVALSAEQAAGREQLSALMGAQDVVSGQAALELARHGDALALARLQSLLHARDAVVRRLAARALGHDLHRGHDARSALVDADPGVRIAAAAAILAG
jgi:hypothetical protein